MTIFFMHPMATLWESEDHFTAWTKSEAFRKAHPVPETVDIYLGHPEFEGFETDIPLVKF